MLCILLIRVVVQSALTYSRERDQQTIDSLLTCPVSTAAIVGSKWLGCMLSVRKLWLWPLAVWAIGIYEIGMSLSLILTLVAFWIVYAGVGALFGQWCSLTCRTGLRAIVLTLLALGITTSGVLMIPLQVFGSYVVTETTPGFRTWVLRGQLATSPPIVFGRMIPNRFAGAIQDKHEPWERRHDAGRDRNLAGGWYLALVSPVPPGACSGKPCRWCAVAAKSDATGCQRPGCGADPLSHGIRRRMAPAERLKQSDL